MNHPPENNQATSLMGLLRQANFWAIGVLLGIALTTFLTWDFLPLMGIRVPVRGIDMPAGKLILVLSMILAGAAFVSRARRDTLWKPAVMGLVALALIGFAIQHIIFDREGTQTIELAGVQEGARQQVIYVTPGWGIYVLLGLAFVLVIVAIEMIRERREIHG